MKPKKAVVTPLTPPVSSRKSGALAAPLIAGLFSEAGVMLRPGRADIISGSLGAAVAKFRPMAHKLAFEREPGLFPAAVERTAKQKGARK